MSTTAGLNVEIADAIRADPDLLRDVAAATAYLDMLHDFTDPPAGVRWDVPAEQPARPDHRPAVTVTVVDLGEYGSKAAVSPPLTRVRTRSADSRNHAVMRVWTELLQHRSDVIRRRIDDRLSELGPGEPDAR